MKSRNLIKITLALLACPILVSCSQKSSNIDFNFKSLKKPTKISTKKENNKTFSIENNLYIKDLISPITKEKILSDTKIGKKDPFSKNQILINQLSLDLKLTGFINTKINKYVIVSYLNNLGTLTEESVGGVNTNLLPIGAKVVSIDPKNNKLIISFENENFTFEL